MIGLIGGSGIYEALDLDNAHDEHIGTPFGSPSSPITIGELDGEAVAFLARHGHDHQHAPSEVPYRANLYALKDLGAERVLSTNAVGSLREDLPPQNLVVPDQIFDRTKHRQSTFFDERMVVHMGFAEPYCPHMSEHLLGAADDVLDDGAHAGGTYVCIEGPQFSTKAESEFYRAQGWDMVGMTTVPEAKLAREAELCYATLAGVTDYDVWKDDSEVSLEEVLENAEVNEDNINEVVREAIETMPDDRDCDCEHALDGTINTASEAIPDEVRDGVDLFIGEYLD
ncbi:S-methyl-5'-thioadenosine phosphorylase [Halococcus salsus]|uniref:S-methyl-5'-thioadenosine phosphorylase n=1 Tax=Halococcus salsus TaxID=2162894 RepID=UPI001358C347|nr:S-methyl-5'-thioadenosine phosphorylase [Halococcus salsus]